jgi:succinate dehydrogenase / fumarate reductase, membrane anchor subunit
MSLRSPLGRVLGSGAANEGAHHWWVQRLTALALIPLGMWFVVSLITLPITDHAALVGWLAHGWNALLMLAFVLVAAWHSRLGVQVVVEDYVHSHGLKTLALILNTFAHILLAAAAVYAVLRVAL